MVKCGWGGGGGVYIRNKYGDLCTYHPHKWTFRVPLRTTCPELRLGLPLTYEVPYLCKESNQPSVLGNPCIVTKGSVMMFDS